MEVREGGVRDHVGSKGKESLCPRVVDSTLCVCAVSDAMMTASQAPSAQPLSSEPGSGRSGDSIGSAQPNAWSTQLCAVPPGASGGAGARGHLKTPVDLDVASDIEDCDLVVVEPRSVAPPPPAPASSGTQTPPPPEPVNSAKFFCKWRCGGPSPWPEPTALRCGVAASARPAGMLGGPSRLIARRRAPWTP